MPNLEFPLPVVESGRVYAPGSLALEITNLQRTNQDTLRSVRGPCPLIADAGQGYPADYGYMHGVFHARLDNGQREVTLIRTGTKLIEHVGWRTTSGAPTRVLASGLSSDPNARFPDQFCLAGGKVVWANGVDTPLVYDGYKILPLGYTETPSAPTPLGPGSSGHPIFPNNVGYAHPGSIGTVGEVYDAGEGALLQGAWYYAVQYEDAFGNLSPLSPLGGPITMRPERTQGFYWRPESSYPKKDSVFTDVFELGLLAVNLDDLTKQFYIEGIPLGPEGTVARRVYRTPNAIFNPTELKLLVRIPDNITTSIPDNTPDGGLGGPADDAVTVPRFGVMVAHQGRLWAWAGSRLYYSQVGFPGTFLRDDFIEPDPNGGEGTGLASWGGDLFAFTETSTFSVLEDAEGVRTRSVSSSVGCVAPSSIRAVEWGELVWVASDGFKAMGKDRVPRSISRDIDTLFSTFNAAYLSRATAVWKSSTREYLCAVPLAGVPGNNLILVYDGQGFRRLQYGIRWGGLCETQDWTRRILGVGKGAENNVFVLDAEHASYTPPTKTSTFRSTWIKPDVFGRKRFTAATIYIGIVEDNRSSINVTIYKNGRNDSAVGDVKTREMCAPDLPATYDTAVVGTAVVRTGRQSWKKVSVRLPSVESFQILIEATEPVHMHIHALSFDFTYEDSGNQVSEQ